ncbi:DUF2061 domain-containing protein [Vibrio sp.]|nr:DUF2061 domain-containing protein [Vibrio sp.]
MKKTITFAGIHFTIAFTVAYLLTGDVILGSMIAMLEPTINTVAFYCHEKFWISIPTLQRNAHRLSIKTLSFACVHFTVAFTVAYALTGSWLIGGVMALIEPSINTVAFYLHERVWFKKSSLSNLTCTH